MEGVIFQSGFQSQKGEAKKLFAVILSMEVVRTRVVQ